MSRTHDGFGTSDDTLPDRCTPADVFNDIYARSPDRIPWDIDQAQPRLIELEALGGIHGEVLDIGCGLGDNAIFLAGRGYNVTAIDASPLAVDRASIRATRAGVTINFVVADATHLIGYDGKFDTVVDSALYHCLDETEQQTYAAAMHRVTRPGARWHMYCFSDGHINGITAAMAAAPERLELVLEGIATLESKIRQVLPAAGWRIDFLGPTTYLANGAAFTRDVGDVPQEVRNNLSGATLAKLCGIVSRYAKLAGSELVHLPCIVVHAARVC